MKAALVFQSLGIGGVERVGVEYAHMFQELGYEVDIYNLDPSATEMEPRFPKGAHIYHKYLPEFLLPDRYFNGVKRWWWGKYAYPLLYLGTSILLYLYRFTMGRRRSYDISVAFSGHFRDLTFVSRNFIKGKKKTAWLHVGSLMDNMVASSAYGDIYRKLKNICTLSSDGDYRVLLRNIALRDLNIHRIYNPLRLEQEKLDTDFIQELKDTYGDFLLMVGRFDPDKDQKTVILAYHKLYQEHNLPNKLVFVGGGSTLAECRSLAESLGLSHQITFFGPRQDVANFYSAAHLALHSSPAEGLGVVLLEAMKYRLPVVATDSPPGVREVLGHDEYGLTCRVGDYEDMAEKILRMLTDPSLYEHYQKQGQKRIVDFSYEKIREELARILDELK
ncbi:MAG: glycosyltransferase [Lachnospiraceae bacterium]|nr:glycosyltransferase [Lachnospiraceae bacterium]